MSPSLFKIGLSGCGGGLEAASTRDLLDLAERAEAWGFEGLWLNEEHFQGSQVDIEGRRCLSPLILAAAIAARTQRLRIGFSVLLLALHHPIRLAEDLATLDVLSEGRVDFGVSRGGNKRYLSAFRGGSDPDDFDSALQVMIRAWRPRTVDLGEAEVSIEPKPVQTPHPPIYVGTYTETTAEAAARAGHRLICHGITSPELIGNLIGAFCAGGGDAAEVPVGRFVYVAETDDAARRELWPTLLKLTTRLRMIARSRAGLMRAEDLEPEAFYRRMVIAGSPQTCAEQILAMHHDFGTTYLNALSAFFGFLPMDQLLRSLELLARDVKPQLARATSC